MSLVYSMWILAILLLTMTSNAGSLRRAAREANGADHVVQLRTAAISGLCAFTANLSAVPATHVAHADPLSCMISLPDSIEVFVYDGWFVGRDAARVPVWGASFEESRLNLRQASAGEIQRLPGVSAHMAQALVRERSRFGGVVPSDLPSLIAIPGWENYDFESLRDLAGFHGSGMVDVNAASRAVLRCLGLSDSAAQQVERCRLGPDGISATRDDIIFPSLQSLCSQLHGAGATDEAIAEISALGVAHRLTVRSTALRCCARSLSLRDGSQFEIFAIVDLSSPDRYLYWRERAI